MCLCAWQYINLIGIKNKTKRLHRFTLASDLALLAAIP